MKSQSLLYLAFTLSYFSYSQNVWTKLTNTPSSNIIGQLVTDNGLINQGVVEEKIITYTGASSFTQSNFKEWSVSLTTALSLDRIKFDSVTYKNIKIDALSDKEIFSNSKYYNNFFVYRAKRADSVYFTFSKKMDLSIRPTEILSDSILLIKKLKTKFPNLDSLQVVANSKDKITYLIANPKVYFEAEIIQFKANNRFIFNKKKFDHTEFMLYNDDSKESDLLEYGKTLSTNIDFKGGVMFTLMTVDTLITNPTTQLVDTSFRLGFDISQTYRNECFYNPMPYKFDFDKTSFGIKKYKVSENILLSTSDGKIFLAVYLTINGVQTKDGVLLQRRLTGQNTFFANRLDYINLKFKRYNKDSIQ